MAYAEMVWDLHKHRIDKELELFPNHAEFIEKWYEELKK
jgi:hypothetical protein